ncbi:carboxypeptidase-like regulatory domain-containing protein [Amycolatopsis silviterrae]|uniref:Carboxypeptidase-like regulatory domain-containing protein n=1 Tax=Amycolatopsis silviterrae TaxID=1656914 RepID=A0ABW5HC67_9PSEU
MDDAGETPPIEQGRRTRAAILLPPRRPATSAGGVSGRVRRANGAAVGGAELALVDATGNQVDVTRSRGDGTYALRTAGDGRYLLTCTSPQGPPSAEFITVLAGRLRQDVVVPEDAGRLSGVFGTPGSIEAEEPAMAPSGLPGRGFALAADTRIDEAPAPAEAGDPAVIPSGRIGLGDAPLPPNAEQGAECR